MAKKITCCLALAALLTTLLILGITFIPSLAFGTPAKGITLGVQTPYFLSDKEVTHGTELELGYLNDFQGWLGGPIIYLGHGDVIKGNSTHVAYGIGLEALLLLNPHFMVVGEGMHYTPGMAAKATQAMADAGVNLEMINQGASEISMMFGVRSEKREAAVKALYAEFFGNGSG